MSRNDIEQHDFHLKRVTQSQYRGGSARVASELHDPFADRDIPTINLENSNDKAALKAILVERTDVILTNILPLKVINEIKKSGYLDDILKQLGI